MPRRLYLVRHGETNNNKHGIIQGKKIVGTLEDGNLNSTGQIQAKYTKKALKNICFESVYSSGLPRAKETADIVAIYPKNIIKDSRLDEINHGIIEGLTFIESKEKFPEFRKIYENKPSEAVFPSGEGIIEAKTRIFDFTKEALCKRSSGNALIVSHGGIISLMIIEIFCLDVNIMFHAIRHNNCGISIIEWPHLYSNPRVVCINSTGHLDSLDPRLMDAE